MKEAWFNVMVVIDPPQVAIISRPHPTRLAAMRASREMRSHSEWPVDQQPAYRIHCRLKAGNESKKQVAETPY